MVPQLEGARSELAELLLKLSGLLAAGLSSANAMRYLQASFDELPQAESADFYRVWRLANRLGGSVLTAVERQIETLQNRQMHLRNIELAMAAPRATAKLVMALPVLGLLLAQLSGLRPVEAVFSNPIGFIAVAIGAGLMVIGRIWSDSMISKAVPRGEDPAAGFDELVIALDAGLNASQAIDEVDFDSSQLAGPLEISRATGASLATLVAAEANSRRLRHWHQSSAKISRLSVNLMIPLGLTSLPAFALIALVPVAIGLMTS